MNKKRTRRGGNVLKCTVLAKNITAEALPAIFLQFLGFETALSAIGSRFAIAISVADRAFDLKNVDFFC